MLVVFVSCGELLQNRGLTENVSVNSPNGVLKVTFNLEHGVPYYNVQKEGNVIINNSKMGFILQGLPSLEKDFKIVEFKESSFDETWTQPWGEVKDIRNNYKNLFVALEENTGSKRRMNIIFKVYNDGIGFRYEIPEQPNLKKFNIMDELTEFSLAYNFDTWWIPAYNVEMDYEVLFKKNKLSELKEKMHTPVTMELGDSLFISIHEAALLNYAGMTVFNPGDQKLKCDLVPWSSGIRVETITPLKTPWRTIQIAEKPGDLITSYLILNLNEPNKLNDVSWIKPGKYQGIWWAMHIKKYTWEGGPNHGATTENVKKLIDFSSEYKLDAVLAEGWNEDWKDWVTKGNFNFSKPYPDFDIEELSQYGKRKNVGLIAHHETAGFIDNYERQMEDAFKFCEKYGIHHLKTGYVAKLLNGKERHQSQYGVRHYNKVMEMAAKYKVMLDIHEPVKDTGLRRTYPNMMTREGACGMEYEAWSVGNPPEHTVIVPFTRSLAGPFDYTPGVFDILIEEDEKFRVHTTLAKQLALYVTIYSPLHMVPDLPENYEKNLDAFKFIVDVPTDWSETKVLNAKIGDYFTVARKDRKSEDWYVGSITDEEGRVFDLTLDFLESGKKYRAEIYADGKDVHVEHNPLPITISSTTVDSNTTLQLKLAPGGGQAIRLLAIE